MQAHVHPLRLAWLRAHVLMVAAVWVAGFSRRLLCCFPCSLCRQLLSESVVGATVEAPEDEEEEELDGEGEGKPEKLEEKYTVIGTLSSPDAKPPKGVSTVVRVSSPHMTQRVTEKGEACDSKQGALCAGCCHTPGSSKLVSQRHEQHQAYAPSEQTLMGHVRTPMEHSTP